MRLKKYFLLLLLTSCHFSQKTPEPPKASVMVSPVVCKPVELYVKTYGHGQAYLNVDIRSQVEGMLTDVYFNDGQEIKKGDLLCLIDKRPYVAALQAQEALLAENTAQLKYAEDTVKRYTSLVQEEYVSQLNFEQYLTNASVYEGLVKQSRAQVETAAINLSYCTIESPIDGLASELQIDAGNLVTPNQTVLLTIRQLSPVYVTFVLPEYELPRLMQCQRKKPIKVVAEIDASTREIGTLDFIENTVDASTGTIALRGIFNNEEKNLWPGQFTHVKVYLETIEEALVIPKKAVQLSQTGKFVFVVKEDNTVEQRQIQELTELEEMCLITCGLKEGEKVVTEGQFNLYPGAKVNIKAQNSSL